MKHFSYSDVSLIPKYANVESRSQCDTSLDFLGWKFAMPVMPANMRCSIDFTTAKWCRDHSVFYALHRFYPYREIFEWLPKSKETAPISISLGVQEADEKFVENIKNAERHVDFITIDVAHGHCQKVMEMVKHVKSNLPDVKVIVGNVASVQAVRDVTYWGADAVKVGIGQGAVCTTRLQTGFGLPMFTCIEECYKNGSLHECKDYGWVSGPASIPIIADGGLQYYGDAAKALVAGATMVMSGSMFARCKDSPAESYVPTEVVHTEFGPSEHPSGPLMKRWYGSASEHNKGQKRHVEGILTEEPCNNLTYGEMMLDWKEALQSAISYAGGNDLSAFRKVKHAIV